MLSGLAMLPGWFFQKRARFSAALVFFFFAPVLAAETVEIKIAGQRFVPAQVRIKAGDSVRWLNEEKRSNHSVAFPEEGALESERIFPGEHWQRIFTRPGIYPYRCGPHPEMTGVIHVE